MNRKGVSLILGSIILISAFFTVVSVLPLNVRAMTLFVGGTGPGNHTSIQSAIENSSIGDTVYVHAGWYNEDIVIDKALQLIGENRNTTIINGSSTGNVVTVLAEWVTISSFNITGSRMYVDYSGIALFSAHNGIIVSNNISCNYQGIYLDHSNFTNIANNHIVANHLGIRAEYSHWMTIDTNSFSVNRGSISFSRTGNSTIIDNVLVNNTFEIGQFASINNTYSGNSMTNTGISIMGSALEHWDTQTIDTTNKIDNRPIYYWKNVMGGKVPLDASQVILVNCTDVVVENLEFENSSEIITIAFSSRVFIANNTASSVAGGIELFNTDDSTVINNSLSFSWRYGIELSQSHNNTITHNMMQSYFIYGIVLDNSHDNLIENNNASGAFFDGIGLYDSNNNDLIGNTVWNNTQNILISGSDDNTIINNTAYGQADYGVRLRAAKNTFVSNNTILYENGEYGIWSYDSDGSILVNNTVAGGWEIGIHSYYSDDTIINDNDVSMNKKGILLEGSTESEIIGNQVFDNEKYGIAIDKSSRNTFADNTVIHSHDGVFIHESDNITIVNNSVYSNLGVGMWFTSSYFNTVANNSISNNRIGLYFWFCRNNTIYLNSILANQDMQAFDNGVNIWDGNYSIGGNYWSDYEGVDEKSGPKQTLPGGDGFGDTPYIVEGGNNTDRFPLTSPVATAFSPPMPPQNLQVTVGNGVVTLTWDGPSFDGGSIITEFRIHRRVGWGEETLLAVTGSVYSYTDSTVVNWINYRYRISAVNSAGEGPMSNAVDAMPVNEHPTCVFIEPSPGVFISGTFTMNGTAHDPDGVVQKVEVRIDDGDWIVAIGATAWSYEWDTTTIPFGVHTIYARSYDGENNSDEVSVTIFVDNEFECEDGECYDAPVWPYVAVAIVLVLVPAIMLALHFLIRKKREQPEAEEPPDSDEPSSD